MTDVNKPWYKKWFNDDYLKLYQQRDNKDAKKQIELVLKTLKPDKNNKILDLGCGEGRHLSYFNKLGFKTFGLDLSKELIYSGMKKYGRQNFILGDIRNIPGKYDIILSFFSSFGYFESDKENFSVFDSIFKSLTYKGKFWFDFLNPEYVKNNLIAKNQKELSPDKTAIEERKIENKRVIKKISFISKDKTETYYESVRLFKKEELEAALNQSGFAINNIFANYSGDQWTNNSERTIFNCQKSRLCRET